MKSAPFFAIALLTLGSCAPKAIVLSEGFALNLQNPSSSEDQKPTPQALVAEPLPNINPNDGLLDPPGLTSMPADRDMKATVDERKTSPVIANPPTPEKPTSE